MPAPHEGGDGGKHSAAHAAFGIAFAKPALLDPRYHLWLLDAFDLRLQDDYETLGIVNEELVEEMLKQARSFLGAARLFLADSTDSSANDDVPPTK